MNLSIEPMYEEHLFIENDARFMGNLFGNTKTMVRGTTERELPNNERIRDHTDAALPQADQRLLAERLVYIEYDKLHLTFSLEKLNEAL